MISQFLKLHPKAAGPQKFTDGMTFTMCLQPSHRLVAMVKEMMQWLQPVAKSPLPNALPGSSHQQQANEPGVHYRRLALHPQDSRDPLLIVITPSLQVALALHGREGRRQLLIRSDPAALGDGLTLIGRSLQEQDPAMAEQLHTELKQLGPLHTDDTLTERFWPRLAERLSTMAPSITLQTTPSKGEPSSDEGEELSLLEALSHEVRTPLATIRTLIRSLTRRRDLPAVVMKRLRQIDVECGEQVDR